MDFEWIKGVNCLSKQTWEGWLSLWWFWTENFEHTNRGREELLACWRRVPGGAYIGEAGRPRWPRASPGASFLQRDDLPLWLSCSRAPLVAPPKLSHPLLCLHYWSFHLMPLLWVMSMLPCFTCHHEFPAKQCLLPPMLIICMWSWWKLLKGHPMMYHGAFMICLTRLPPSKHVLRLSTPLISKIKNNFRAIRELKHKFSEVFKLLKTNVSQKYFLTTFISVSPVLFDFISWEQTFSGLIMGA
jgi:hypothetical protein